LNRLREELFQYHAVSVAGFVFQACSFNHSDISPRLESISYERSNKDYRTRRRFPAGLPPSPSFQRLTRRERGHRLGIVSDLLTSRDHLRRQDIQWPLSVDPLVRPSVFFSGIFKRPELGYRGRSGDRRGEYWLRFDAMRTHYDSHRALAPGVSSSESCCRRKRTTAGGCHVLSPMAIQAAVWLEQTVPDRPPDGSTLLGYDLADASLISGLSN
jgi:hypothetical protein